MKCPICQHDKTKKLLSLNCGGFDESRLYRRVIVLVCKKCGHIFNQLNKREINNLTAYYTSEYAPNNLSYARIAKIDRPGGTGIQSLKRYENLYKIFRNYIKPKGRILDGGCATGGFLDFLNKKGFKKLYGFDISDKFIKASKNKNKFCFRQGSVVNIPFSQSDSFELVILDQVLEHIVNPQAAFKEIKRVLSPGGILCISVPDASRYNKNFFFDFYGFLLKEHVQHFDIHHLKLIAELNGFELLNWIKTDASLGEAATFPVVSAVFRFTNHNDVKIKAISSNFNLLKSLEHYLKKSFNSLNKKRSKIKYLATSGSPVYFYGISQEFLYLYEQAGIEKCKIAGLIDDIPFKQKKLKVHGISINTRAVLKKAPQDSFLVITAFPHIPTIKSNVRNTGYRGSIVDL